MGQGQTGFQPLLLLHKLCPIHPSKQMAATLSPSNRELPSLAQTCFISLLQNPTETPRVHCQNPGPAVHNNSGKIQCTFKAGRKYKPLKPNHHPTHSIWAPALLWAPAAACRSWESGLTQAPFHLGGLWLRKPGWGK